MSSKCFRLTILLLGCFLINNTFAGLPFISDDPEIQPQHHPALFLFSAYNKQGSDMAIALPGFEIDFGLLPNVEIDFTGSYLLEHPGQGDGNEKVSNTSGMSDSQLELKLQFIHETATQPAVAFNPIYYIPTGDVNRNLGNGRPSFLLPLWAQKSWGDYTLYGGGGYVINPAPELKNHAIGGIVLQKNITEKLNLGCEMYSAGAESVSEKFSTLLNIGGTYQFSKFMGLQAMMGHSILGQKQIVAYLGVVFAT